MKKKLLSALLCTSMAASLFAGCGAGSEGGVNPDEATEGESAESEVVTNTYGDPNGTHLEMWTFVTGEKQDYGKDHDDNREDEPRQLRACPAKDAVDELALRRRLREHVLEVRCRDAGEDLPQDGDKFLREVRAGEELELRVDVVEADELEVVLRNRHGENGHGPVDGLAGVFGEGNPELRLPAQELRLGRLDAGLRLRHEVKPRLAVQLLQEEPDEAGGLFGVGVDDCEGPWREVDFDGCRILDPLGEPLRLGQ